MGLGNYGNTRPADVSVSDIDIILVYLDKRDSTQAPQVTRLTASDVITPIMNNEETGGASNEILGGLYNLTLPSDVFSQKGIYNLYVRPAQIRTKILDCGVLSTSPDIKGLVFDISNFPSEFLDKFSNDGLVGYRVEYLNTDGSKQQNLFRVITSAFLCEPVNQNLTNTSQKAVRYRYNDSGTLLFATITPSSAPTNKPNAVPYIGKPNQDIIITNTFFDPVNIEIEVVDYDTEAIAINLFGNQSRSIEDGIFTQYDFDGNIFNQYDVYEINNSSGDPLFEIKKRRTSIDFSKNFNQIT